MICLNAAFCGSDDNCCVVRNAANFAVFIDPRPRVARRAGQTKRKVQRMQVTRTHVQNAAVIGR